jgi:hypothetical protein
VSRDKKSINTRETAFDLTVDDEKSSKLLGLYSGRENPAESRMQQAAAASGEGDTTPGGPDAYEVIESLDQPERSKSLSPKRRTTSLTRASPVQGDSGRSVAFRPPPHVSKSTPKERPVKRSDPDGEVSIRKAYAKNASQKSSPGPGLVPSPSTVNKTSKSFRDLHGELAPNLLGTTNTRERPAAEVLFKSASPAPGPTSKKVKRTMNSKKTPSGDVVSHKSSILRLSVSTSGPKRLRDAPLSAVEELTADPKLSAAVQDKTNRQAPRDASSRVHQQEPKDRQAVLGYPSNGGPDSRIFEPVNIGDPINRAAGPEITRSASCTDNGPGQSTGEAGIPPRNKKSMIKVEPTERETSSPRLDKDRVASPKPQAFKISEVIKDSSGITSGVGVIGTKTMAAAMVAEQTLLSKIEGGLTTEPAIDLLNTSSESHMEQCMRRHLKELHDNHEYFMKVEQHHI